MKRSADVAHLEWLEPESDEGNVEYKLRLKDPSTMRFQQLVTQMKFRLSEGNGECFYYLGEQTYETLSHRVSRITLHSEIKRNVPLRPTCSRYVRFCMAIMTELSSARLGTC